MTEAERALARGAIRGGEGDPAHTEPMDEDPQLSVIRDSRRIVYGNLLVFARVRTSVPAT